MSDPSPSPAAPHASGESPTPDDVITGSVQEALNSEQEEVGHMVLDWILVANVLAPDGRDFVHMRFPDGHVSWTNSLGLVEYARQALRKELDDQLEEERDE